MRIIDAYWEKRNLGVTTTEVIIEDSDSFESINNLLLNLSAEYQVVRVPVGRLDIYHLLSQRDYYFIEAMYHVKYDFTITPLVLNDNEKDVSYCKINSTNDIDTIFHNINNNMFNTDRISLDPNFNNEKTARRYLGMISDKLDQGAEIFFITKENQNIGFFMIHRDNTGIYNCVLTGLFPPFQKKGLGSNVVTQMLRCAGDKGEKQFISHVSTNNRASFELHTKRGFQTGTMEYLFVKHKRNIL